MQHLLFRLGQEDVAIPISSIRRLVPLADLEPLATRQPAIRGFLRFEGRAIPVLDLALLRGLAPTPEQMSTRLALLGEGQALQFAVMVERALEIVDFKVAPRADSHVAQAWRDSLFDEAFDDGQRLVQVVNWQALLGQDWLRLVPEASLV